MAFWKFAGISGLALVLCGCGDSEDTTTTTTPGTSDETIAEIAVGNKDLSTLVAALSAADLVDVFNGTDKYTVFAPVNAAFEELDQALVTCLLAPVGVAELTKVLKFHVAEGATFSTELTDGMEIPTLDDGEKLMVKINDGTVMVDNATVTTADVNASNGVVHLIDKVLIPPNFMAPDCGTAGSLVDLAKGVPTLSTLVTALAAADLVDTLSTGGPFTVFAPTDAAFKAVEAVVTCLLKEENKDVLTQVLTYHVLPTYLLAANITNDLMEETVDANQSLSFTVKKGTVEINGAAKVTGADNFANNGVAHIIDTVLVPTNVDLSTICGSIFQI